MADEASNDEPMTSDADPPEAARKAAARPPTNGSRRTVKELLSVPREELTVEEREGLDRLSAAARSVGEAVSADLRESIASIGEGIARPYADIVASFMKDRDDALAASAAFDPVDASVLMVSPRQYELEALYDVAKGVDTVAEAQTRAAEQLLHVGELLEALHETIKSGDRSNGRLAKIALVIAVVSLVVTAVVGVLPLLRP